MNKRTIFLFIALCLAAPLMFHGCGGGSAGSPGAPGEQGEGGLPGPVTNTADSCMVCHTTGRLVDIFDPDGDPITHDFAAVNLPNLVVDTIVVEDIGGVPTVSFHVTSNGLPVTALDNSNVRFMMADLVPAGTPTALGTWSTAQFDRWAYERYPAGTAGYRFGTFDNVSDSADGIYHYTFTVPFGSPSPVDNVVPTAFNAAHTQRLYIYISKGGYNRAAGDLDFTIAAAGAEGGTTGIGYFVRQFVTVDACRKCHGPILANTAHGYAYVDVKNCVLCHSPIASANSGDNVTALGTEMTDTLGDAWFAGLIHKIHAQIPMAAFASRINNLGYAGVTYPQDVNNCVTCHTNSGLALGAGDLTNNWRANPTANGCKTCHEAYPSNSHDATPVYDNNGTAHPGGTPADTGCVVCHPADGVGFGDSVTYAHDVSPTSVLHPNPSNVPEFNVTVGLSPVQAFYVAGDNVTVTVTLNNHLDNSAVAGSVYTTAKGAAGTAGGGLSTASLYFYGPRAFPKPVLAAQETKLFVNAADPRVATDNTGFKYNVTIPAGLTTGTYLVRVRIGDFGRVSDANYKVESIAFRTVQIGSATVTPKVAGDSCVDCHGSVLADGVTVVTAPFHDARHVVVWNTDECIGCHDYSGGYAAVLSNRVHAVHAGNSRGDMSNHLSGPFTRNWDLVTFPADKLKVGAITRPIRCKTCHTSTNTSYRSVIHEVACLGCHGDTQLGSTAVGPAISHMLQMGGDYPTP